MKPKFLLRALSLLLLFQFCLSTPMIPIQAGIASDSSTGSLSVCGTPVESEEAASLALDAMKQNGVDSAVLYLRYRADYASTPEYISLRSERDSLKDAAEIKDFRSRAAAQAHQYYHGLYEKVLPLLSDFPSDSIHEVKYAPYILIASDIHAVEPSLLFALLRNECIVSIGVYAREKPVDEGDILTLPEGTDLSKLSLCGETPTDAHALNAGMASLAKLCGTSHKAEVRILFLNELHKDPDYRALRDSRDKVETAEDARGFRGDVSDVIKQYAQKATAQAMPYLSFVPAEALSLNPYSLSIHFTMSPEDIDLTSLLSISSLDNVNKIIVTMHAPDVVVPESDEVSVEISTIQTTSSPVPLSWNLTMTQINDQYVNCEGMVIGVYEAEGICDQTNPNFQEVTLSFRDPSSPISDHATAVASIIARMCPGSTLKVAQYRNNDVGVEWFIDEGCDVVNLSLGYTGMLSYSDIDAIYDYQVQSTFITIVKSAGNTSDAITAPGHAYNVITVGGVNYTSDATIAHSSFASYSCSDPVNKPNLSAIAYLLVPNVTVNGSSHLIGTSYAAPQVTAAVAKLFVNDASLRPYPEEVTAILMATASPTDDSTLDFGHFDNETGAGCLNLSDALSVSASHHTHDDSYTMAGHVVDQPSP